MTDPKSSQVVQELLNQAEGKYSMIHRSFLRKRYDAYMILQGVNRVTIHKAEQQVIVEGSSMRRGN
jgi:hypothetical protein